MIRRTALVLFSAAVFAGGCGDDGEDGSTSSGSSSATSDSTTTGSDSTTTGSDSTTTGSDSMSTSDSGDGTGGSTGGGVNLGDRVELRIDNFDVPTAETYYGCFEFSFGLDQLGHITKFRPFIDNGAHVHHFVLMQIDQPSGNAPGTSCFDLDGDIIWAWAPGLTDFDLPEEAGFLIGNAPDGRAHFKLQVHYNNPQGVSGQVDSSGFDMWVTTDLRPNTAGVLVVADVPGISIPPGEAAYEHITTCRGEVTQNAFEGPINVFGSSLHAHEIGSVLWTEVWRDGQLAYELNRNEPFSFEDQRLDPVDFVIEPGDEIVNHCIYDSTGRSQTTQGGPGTLDEMCWNTLVYYPKISSGFDYCSSGN